MEVVETNSRKSGATAETQCCGDIQVLQLQLSGSDFRHGFALQWESDSKIVVRICMPGVWGYVFS